MSLLSPAQIKFYQDIASKKQSAVTDTVFSKAPAPPEIGAQMSGTSPKSFDFILWIGIAIVVWFIYKKMK